MWVSIAVLVTVVVCVGLFVWLIKDGPFRRVKVRAKAWKLLDVEVELDRNEPDPQ
ncbi:hypothetical protein JOF56_000862 [Kibdelosporangium banguiense]|uniref:Uncharacterized protein n=1 Tax=Kibdelosporangium banguiense TaxID=1365924 RepID=A0ABS4T7T4_9PSEU|nr:hypothetical protein [Kibdelosporangium banguiense]